MSRNSFKPTHGMRRTPTYASWTAMKTRCLNPQSKSYPDYGGKGVAVCERWATSFAAFLADMGERPGGTTLEVTRTCTDGSRNANSMLYGALWRAGVALGYVRGFKYTQAGESGASLKAAGWQVHAELPARADWKDSSVAHRALRDPAQADMFKDHRRSTGGVPRVRWIKAV